MPERRNLFFLIVMPGPKDRDAMRIIMGTAMRGPCDEGRLRKIIIEDDSVVDYALLLHAKHFGCYSFTWLTGKLTSSTHV